VPLIVRGPKIKAGSWCDVPVVGYDWFPTYCEWAGIPSSKLPKGLEGGSLTAVLAGDTSKGVKRSREGLYFHFPHYQSEGGPQSSIRVGDLKLIHFYEKDNYMLFDLATDLQERNDLASKRPEVVKDLKGQLERYLSEVKAQFPTKNTDYTPNNNSQDPRDYKRNRSTDDKAGGKRGGGGGTGGGGRGGAGGSGGAGGGGKNGEGNGGGQ
jgi:uncharacterized membrane protein YgcG